MKLKNKISSFILAAVIITAAFFVPQNAKASIYKGIDIYEYDNIQDWNEIRQAGVSVVIQKATQGISHNDSLLNYRYPRILQAGLKIGYYHYADHTGSALQQADHFLNRIQGLHSDTVLFLDIENEGDWDKQSAINFTNQFIDYVQSKGYKIGIYTGLSFYYEYLQGSIPNNISIWIASYGRKPQQYPNNISWQYAETETMSGIVGYVDGDYFNDSIFTGQAPQRRSNGTSNATTQSSEIMSVSDLQGELNRQGYGSLKVDNIAGKRTLAACPTVHKGSMGNITKWIQKNLGVSADGINGRQTQTAIKEFQKNHGLNCDGIVGRKTWRVLLRIDNGGM